MSFDWSSPDLMKVLTYFEMNEPKQENIVINFLLVSTHWMFLYILQLHIESHWKAIDLKS